MKRRDRSITIFNLSMMDVISGAMGAFLIIMLVLARYYKSDPTTSPSVRAMAEELTDVRRRLEAVDKAMQIGAAPEDLRRQLAEALYKLAQAEGRLNDLRARLDQAAAQIDRLDRLASQLQAERDQARDRVAALEQQVKEQQQQVEKLAVRRPFGVQLWWWGCRDVDVDLYVRDETTQTSDGKIMPAVAPGNQTVFWPGDTFVDDNGRGDMIGGSDSWSVRDAPLSARFAVYVKIAGTGANTAADAVCATMAALFHDGSVESIASPAMAVGDAHRLLGHIRMNESGKPVFTAATATP
ncbi:MAG: hypothetical protein Tsb0016_01680 [Sphingomonadales bacterium]